MIKPIRIPTRNQAQPIVDDQQRATTEFHRWLNGILQQVVYTLNAIAAIPDIQAALLDLDAATLAAQAAADNANMAAQAATDASALANSYVSGLTINASDVGTDVTVSISAHVRHYATSPETTVNVDAGAITGVPYATMDNPTAYIYYDQPSRGGGMVAYQYTFDNTQVAQIGDRHSVGAAPLPASGEASKPGKVITPPGGSYDLPITT